MMKVKIKQKNEYVIHVNNIMQTMVIYLLFNKVLKNCYRIIAV